MKKTILALATSLLSVFTFSTLSQQFVIIESNLLAYKKGDILASTTQLSLDSNGELTVISAQGKLLKIKGPYQDSLGSEVKTKSKNSAGEKLISLVDSLSSLLKDDQEQRLGATRSLTGAFTENQSTNSVRNPWAIDINTQGDQCSRRKRSVLWTTNNSGLSMVIKAKSDDTMTTIHWDKNSEYAPWPEIIIPEDGKNYQLIVSDDYQIREIRLHILDTELNGEKVAQVLWMIKQGCNKQATLLLSSIDVDKVIEKQ